ncbi:hypothetical protein PLICRDRAFT_180191 [Plicaturopsis crispa FD-325 SS-3]|uniref:Uncharacterized protein n=1 Tax=Plicaturopsis crispa FD-325 SS-3 TaxID=944288 RepID=A0A0C9SKJ8_PLICR|nr:hypothetical protein PLICRDRAFT_180191 [Plicaturopsis crispa FD-325 SS-3]
MRQRHETPAGVSPPSLPPCSMRGTALSTPPRACRLACAVSPRARDDDDGTRYQPVSRLRRFTHRPRLPFCRLRGPAQIATLSTRLWACRLARACKTTTTERDAGWRLVLITLHAATASSPAALLRDRPGQPPIPRMHARRRRNETPAGVSPSSLHPPRSRLVSSGLPPSALDHGRIVSRADLTRQRQNGTPAGASFPSIPVPPTTYTPICFFLGFFAYAYTIHVAARVQFCGCPNKPGDHPRLSETI